jgi:hypothetical protein
MEVGQKLHLPSVAVFHGRVKLNLGNPAILQKSPRGSHRAARWQIRSDHYRLLQEWGHARGKNFKTLTTEQFACRHF